MLHVDKDIAKLPVSIANRTLSKEVSYSKIFPDIYPAGLDHMMSVDIRKMYDEEEKRVKLENIENQTSLDMRVAMAGTDKSVLSKQVSAELISMDDEEDDGSYSPPPPFMLDSDVFKKVKMQALRCSII